MLVCGRQLALAGRSLGVVRPARSKIGSYSADDPPTLIPQRADRQGVDALGYDVRAWSRVQNPAGDKALAQRVAYEAKCAASAPECGRGLDLDSPKCLRRPLRARLPAAVLLFPQVIQRRALTSTSGRSCAMTNVSRRRPSRSPSRRMAAASRRSAVLASAGSTRYRF